MNIIKFIALGCGIKYVLESFKARENGNFIREFRCLLWAVLMLISINN